MLCKDPGYRIETLCRGERPNTNMFPRVVKVKSVFGGILTGGVIINHTIHNNKEGSIYYRVKVPADTRLVRPSVERAESGLKVAIRSLVTDRGLDNKINVKWLEEANLTRPLDGVLAPRLIQYLLAQRQLLTT
jgi:hypothetical protein